MLEREEVIEIAKKLGWKVIPPAETEMIFPPHRNWKVLAPSGREAQITTSEDDAWEFIYVYLLGNEIKFRV